MLCTNYTQLGSLVIPPITSEILGGLGSCVQIIITCRRTLNTFALKFRNHWVQ